MTGEEDPSIMNSSTLREGKRMSGGRHKNQESPAMEIIEKEKRML